ncbi:TIR domain-containing protein [Chlorobaculum sp. 24CR]|uniref:TIR domain-containing protein n=1 Tax=Chlorobaculum sp. 24CR TaxID=2508878 RepID=UPI00100BA8D6|nr:TIR domain-containing protein [Chlorobaculum sp. 24CR]RXK88392.1 TIR domain-containing protein [Chlorobaculum sp. 24CR]
MKVFLSWSGTRSHKVALVFRDWLPSVIQEIVPYVSSEDIDKGARWSTDIAKELSDSTFGILCVTRENINAPWLTFEAGALSKTMDKAFVSPFLFNIKRSEVDGPILQFQSTIFEKEDLKKLVTTLNKACEKDGLTSERLSKAFDVWYPTLEDELNNLRDTETSGDDNEGATELQSPKAQEILEEILDLSRINQKLIRNPDGSLGSNLEEIGNLLRALLDRTERLDDPMSFRRIRKFHPIMLDELMHMSLSKTNGYVGAQIALGLLKGQIPWIYDAGIETINILRSRRALEEKQEALDQFRRVMDFSFEHPIMREMTGGSKEMHFLYRRLPEMLMETFERNMNG